MKSIRGVFAALAGAFGFSHEYKASDWDSILWSTPNKPSSKPNRVSQKKCRLNECRIGKCR